jgi:DNA-binding LytR/AlgR family response regulator
MSLRIFLVEDEPPAVAQLERALRRWDPQVEIVGTAASVARSIELLRALAEPDLILADVRLSDGLSLRIFDELRLGCPVIFVTAHDDYVIPALERNAIDYLLKPIQADRLGRAMNKYLGLRAHFGGRLASLANDLSKGARDPERVLARKGSGFVAVPIARAAWFTTQYKQTVLVQTDGRRLLVDEPLGDLEARLGRAFFRLNRQYLASAAAVASFRGGGRGRVLVTLEPSADDEVLISQEAGAPFRAWIAR